MSTRVDITDLHQWLEIGNTFVTIAAPTPPPTRLAPYTGTTIDHLLGWSGVWDEAVIYFQLPDTADLPTDERFVDQWHLWDPVVGINVLGAWIDYTGAGVNVGIFDSGVDFTHPDLAANYNPLLRVTLDGELNNGEPDGTDTTGQANHGTAVAGLIGAARNGVGVVGVAYDSSLTSINIVTPRWNPEIPRLLDGMKNFDVINHSWIYGSPLGDNRTTNTPDSYYGILFAAVQSAADEGRDGLGTVMVQASGNFTMRLPNMDVNTQNHDFDTNLNGMQNSRYTIAVGATNPQGSSTFWSVSGTSLLVVAPDGGANSLVDNPVRGLVTTDRPGADGYTSGDFTNFAGTSAAAPVVTGVVALILEANPELGWRDVQQILAASARHTGSNIGETGITGRVGLNGSVSWTISDFYPWTLNGAQTWNGGGYHYSGDYGYGLVDATAAVRLAESWRVQQTSANEATASTSVTGPWVLEDLVTHTMTFEITEDITVESVEIFLDFTVDHGSIADMDITLTSPDGTAYSVLHDAGTHWEMWDWTLLSRAYLGESARGLWTLTIQDDAAGGHNNATGTLGAVGFTVYGAAATPDDTYIFTNEFAEMLAIEEGRRILDDADGVGIDTLNFATVSGDLIIDMQAGGLCMIDGAVASIAADALFENTYCGDGDDQVVGNGAANQVNGARGDDRIFGNGGDDILWGGLGNDFIDGGSGHDIVTVSGIASSYRLLMDGDNFILKGPDGGDKLANVESIRFSDGRVLELNRMYGPDVDTRAWADGRVPEALLSGGAWEGERPLVLPGPQGDDFLIAKDDGGPEVLPGAEDVFVLGGKGFDLPEILPGGDDWLPAGAKGFDQPEVLPGLDERALFTFDRVTLFDRWSGQMLTADEQGLVVDHYIRGGGWSPDGWGF